MDLFSEEFSIDSIDAAKKLFEESRTGFLKLFLNSPVCMSMTSPERVYVRVNKAFLEKFGFSEAEIIGKNSVQVGILDEEESAKVGRLIKEKGRLHNDYVRCLAKGGRPVHTISSIETMEMNGETYLVSFFQDITKIIEQQTVIERQVQQLEAVNKELEAFSSSVSHDLRAPLRAIHGYSQMLEEDFRHQLPADAGDILETIKVNAARMGALIDALLNLSKSGKKPLQKQTLDMNKMTKETCQLIQQATPHRARLTLHPLPEVEGDYVLIQQVITNLVSNAVKYSSKKEQPEIEIGSILTAGEVTYYVKDNGAGFDMIYAHRLFGVFQRLHSPAEFEGNGIGLSLAQRIIQKHGGRTWAEGKPGEGATFYFSLPL